MAKVELESLRKHYGNVLAVDDVTLTIQDGEFLSLLGPSGSGKTTVLRLIAGFIQATSGDIRIDGRSVAGRPPHERNLGMVAQDYGLFPHMTVASNIAFGLKMRGVPKREFASRVDEALKLVDLQGFHDRRPHQLSGGQKQRVALARALVTRPSVLLLDEPFGALDKKLRETLQVQVRHLQRQVGITTLLVTHDQTEALTMSDRIAVMHQGKLEQIGTPQAIYEQPETRFVADFIGQTNFFQVEVAAIQSGKLTLKGPGGAYWKTLSVPWAREGSRAEYAVRPENVTIVEAHQIGNDKLNSISARIEEVFFLGDRFVITTSLMDGTQCVVSAQKSGHIGDLSLNEGSTVMLIWPQTAGILLKSIS